MRVEILEERLSSDGFAGVAGDILSVPDEVGARWCGLGWARDVAGAVATGERRVVRAVVTPHSAAHGQTAEEA
jgi:hypothetical protein